MLERWSFSFTLSEKRKYVLSTFQQTDFFIPKCWMLPIISRFMLLIASGQGLRKTNCLTSRKKNNPTISQNFTKLKANITTPKIHHDHDNNSATQEKWVDDHSVLETMTIIMRQVKIKDPPVPPWTAAPADDVSAELATCTRNLFQNESRKSCDLLQSLVKHILQSLYGESFSRNIEQLSMQTRVALYYRVLSCIFCKADTYTLVLSRKIGPHFRFDDMTW